MLLCTGSPSQLVIVHRFRWSTSCTTCRIDGSILLHARDSESTRNMPRDRIDNTSNKVFTYIFWQSSFQPKVLSWQFYWWEFEHTESYKTCPSSISRNNNVFCHNHWSELNTAYLWNERICCPRSDYKPALAGPHGWRSRLHVVNALNYSSAKYTDSKCFKIENKSLLNRYLTWFKNTKLIDT